MWMKTTVHIKSVEKLSNDTFFKVVITHEGETAHETLVAESMEELIKRPNIEITYDEDSTIEDVIDDLDMTDAEISDFETDGAFDVYVHKVRAKYGEITYDIEGELVGTYKTERGARNKALKVASKIR